MGNLSPGAHPPFTGQLCFSFKLGPPGPRFKQLSPWVPAPPLQLSVGWVLGTVRVPGPCQWGLTVTGGGSRHRPPEGTRKESPSVPITPTLFQGGAESGYLGRGPSQISVTR